MSERESSSSSSEERRQSQHQSVSVTQVVHPHRTVIPDKGEVDAEAQLHLNCQHLLGKTLASSGPLLYFSLKELQHDTTGPRVKRLTGSWIVLVEKPWSLCGSFDLSVITRKLGRRFDIRDAPSTQPENPLLDNERLSGGS